MTAPPKTTAGSQTIPLSAIPAVVTKTAVTADQRSAIDGYQRAESAFITGSAGAPIGDLSNQYVGTMLAGTQARLDELKRNGETTRYSNPSKKRIDVLKIEIAGDSATLEACEVDDGVVYNVSTKQIVNDDLVSYKTRTALRRIGGRWLVSGRVLLGGKQPGTGLCGG